MEIIIVMLWCTWKCRNGWTFENIPPTTSSYKELFKKEMLLICYRIKQNVAAATKL
jgi:hypothetical protein